MRKQGFARLEEIAFAGHQLYLRFSYDGASFATSFWYDSVDLDALAARFGQQTVERIGFRRSPPTPLRGFPG